MTEFGIASGADPVVAGLALLAALLFAAAVRSGRWSLWVLGYLAAVATLGGVFFLSSETAVSLRRIDVPVQRSPDTGVVEYVHHPTRRLAPAPWRDGRSTNETTMSGIEAGQAWQAERGAGLRARRTGTSAPLRPDVRDRASETAARVTPESP